MTRRSRRSNNNSFAYSRRPIRQERGSEFPCANTTAFLEYFQRIYSIGVLDLNSLQRPLTSHVTIFAKAETFNSKWRRLLYRSGRQPTAQWHSPWKIKRIQWENEPIKKRSLALIFVREVNQVSAAVRIASVPLLPSTALISLSLFSKKSFEIFCF